MGDDLAWGDDLFRDTGRDTFCLFLASLSIARGSELLCRFLVLRISFCELCETSLCTMASFSFTPFECDDSQLALESASQGAPPPPHAPSVSSDESGSSCSREWEEAFVEDVKRYHCLWDTSSPDYKDRLVHMELVE